MRKFIKKFIRNIVALLLLSGLALPAQSALKTGISTLTAAATPVAIQLSWVQPSTCPITGAGSYYVNMSTNANLSLSTSTAQYIFPVSNVPAGWVESFYISPTRGPTYYFGVLYTNGVSYSTTSNITSCYFPLTPSGNPYFSVPVSTTSGTTVTISGGMKIYTSTSSFTNEFEVSGGSVTKSNSIFTKNIQTNSLISNGVDINAKLTQLEINISTSAPPPVSENIVSLDLQNGTCVAVDTATYFPGVGLAPIIPSTWTVFGRFGTYSCGAMSDDNSVMSFGIGASYIMGNGWLGNSTGVYISTNSGNSYFMRTLADGVPSVIKMSRDGSVQFAAAGVPYISFDYGNSWAREGNVPTADAWDIDMSSDGTKQVTVDSDHGLICVSTTTGNTWWTYSTFGAGNVKMSKDGTKILAGGDGRIYISTDTGSTFTTVDLGGSHGNYGTPGAAMSDDGVVQATSYLAYYADGSVAHFLLHLSTTSGVAWFNAEFPVGGPQSPQSVRISGDGTKLFAFYGYGAGKLLWLTEDFGLTWTSSTICPIDVPHLYDVNYLGSRSLFASGNSVYDNGYIAEYLIPINADYGTYSNIVTLGKNYSYGKVLIDDYTDSVSSTAYRIQLSSSNDNWSGQSYIDIHNGDILPYTSSYMNVEVDFSRNGSTDVPYVNSIEFILNYSSSMVTYADVAGTSMKDAAIEQAQIDQRTAFNAEVSSRVNAGISFQTQLSAGATTYAAQTGNYQSLSVGRASSAPAAGILGGQLPPAVKVSTSNLTFQLTVSENIVSLDLQNGTCVAVDTATYFPGVGLGAFLPSTWTVLGTLENYTGGAMSDDGKYISVGVYDYQNNSSQGRMFVSTDSGKSFVVKNVDGSGGTPGAIKISRDGRIQLADIGYLYRSDDYGNTWISEGESAGGAAGDEKNYIAMSSDAVKQVVTNLNSNVIHFSTTTGNSWVDVSLIAPQLVKMSGDGSKITITSYNQGLVYVSTNTGNTFTTYDILYHSNYSKSLAMSDDGSIQAISDYRYDSVFHIFISTNYWVTNVEQNLPEGGVPFSISMSGDGKKLFAIWPGQSLNAGHPLWCSTDLGVTWSSAPAVPIDNPMFCGSSYDGSKTLFVGSSWPTKSYIAEYLIPINADYGTYSNIVTLGKNNSYGKVLIDDYTDSVSSTAYRIQLSSSNDNWSGQSYIDIHNGDILPYTSSYMNVEVDFSRNGSTDVPYVNSIEFILSYSSSMVTYADVAGTSMKDAAIEQAQIDQRTAFNAEVSSRVNAGISFQTQLSAGATTYAAQTGNYQSLSVGRASSAPAAGILGGQLPPAVKVSTSNLTFQLNSPVNKLFLYDSAGATWGLSVSTLGVLVTDLEVPISLQSSLSLYDVVVATGSVLCSTAVLTDANLVPLAGRTVNFYFNGSTFTAVTDGSGIAISTFTAPDVPEEINITATFNGDTANPPQNYVYGASSTSTLVNVYIAGYTAGMPIALPGLISIWRLDNISTGSYSGGWPGGRWQLTDALGTNPKGILYGCNVVKTKYGYGYDFKNSQNPSPNWVLISGQTIFANKSPASNNFPMTWIFRIQCSTTPIVTDAYLMSHGGSAYYHTDPDHYIKINPDRHIVYQVAYGNSTPDLMITTMTLPMDGNYHTLCVGEDASTLFVYLENTTEVQNKKPTSYPNLLIDNGWLQLGAGPAGDYNQQGGAYSEYSYAGVIDEIAVFSTALTYGNYQQINGGYNGPGGY